MKAKFSYVRFLISLSFLVGIFESVNWINLVLQGIQISVLHCHETLVAFKMKLELWHAKLEKKFVLQWTWTELTEFFLQKTKRKKRKLPYGESDMKIGCGREVERRGKAAANTGPSTNSEGRANSLAEETEEHRGSGSLQYHSYR
ncbi:hypothetical protein T4E_4498 [Trichinella pseudospiralis]|uniref:Uncharacterized protein n=1 Tax=Trichinella pseudospiralis TaxID=6337 RepID=A0A0V0YP30_TRIPS|nr:hypothetical protein T4E_4498 [Trichinella pseudospiralis]